MICRTFSSFLAAGRSGAPVQAAWSCILNASSALSTSATEAAGTRIPEPWRQGFAATPPVRTIPGMPAPEALSWLRRRGPNIPSGELHRLFRQRQVRVLREGRVARIKPGKQLEAGDVLLVPWRAEGGHGNGGDHAPPPPPPLPRHGSDRQPLFPGGAGSAAAALAAPPHAPSAQGARTEGEEAGDAALAAPPLGRRRRAPLPRPARAEEAAQPDAIPAAGRAPPPPAASARAQPPGPPRSPPLAAEAAHTPPSPRTPPPPPQQQQQQRQQRHAGAASAAEPEGRRLAPLPSVEPRTVRSWILRSHRDFFVLNKPAGVAVQGSSTPSLDSMIREALRYGQEEEPRIVHRLDQRVSGALMVARSADAAAWLSACFSGRTRSAAAAAEGAGGGAAVPAANARGKRRLPGRRRAGGGAVEPSGEDDPLRGFWVRRKYWAVVQGALKAGNSGRLRSMVQSEGLQRAAVTDYRVLASGEGVSWLELTPRTGRKHQLRLHCGKLLGAPILGDYKYGYTDRAPDERQQPRLASFGARVAGWAGRSAPLAPALAGAALLEGRHRPRNRALSSPTGRPAAATGTHAASGASGGAAPPAARAHDEPLHHSGGLFVPIFLHARELAVGRPRKKPVEAVAPLPLYMVALMKALEWRIAAKWRRGD